MDLGLERLGLEHTQLEPHLQVQFHIDVVNPRGLLLVQFRSLVSAQCYGLLTLEDRVQFAGVLVALIERVEEIGVKPGILVQCTRFDVVVVDSEPLVGVSDGDVEGHVVVEHAVAGVVELGEGGVGHVNLHHVGAHDQPEQEDRDPHDDHDGEDDFED